MAAIGLAEAARLTGKNQSTIHRAMRTGRLSYTKDEAGERRIEVAELARVFGIKGTHSASTPSDNGASPSNDAGNHASHDTQGGELAVLQRLLDDRDRTVADLREADRARVQERLTGLLTHCQAGSVPADEPAAMPGDEKPVTRKRVSDGGSGGGAPTRLRPPWWQWWWLR